MPRAEASDAASSRPRRIAWAALVIAAALLVGVGRSAGTAPIIFGGVGADGAGAGDFVSFAGLDLVVARIVEVSDANATIANPPHVTLDVERVLRGEIRPGRIRALWVMEPAGMMLCGNMTKEERDALERYHATPAPGPRVGDRMLLGGRRLGQDSLWRAYPEVRFRDSDTLRGRVGLEARRADGRREGQALRDRQRGIAQRVADDHKRRNANLHALVRASTDIVVARIRPRSHELELLARLYEAPRDSLAVRINASLECCGYRYRSPVMQLSFEDHEGGAARLVKAADDESGNMAAGAPAYVCFLRRRAFTSYDGGEYPMALADSDAGLLPADSTTIKAVRRIVVREAQRGPWTPSPPAECGASWARFASLAGSEWESVRVRIMYARVGTYPERRQSFVFGSGLPNHDRSFIPLCDRCGERAWSDQLSSRYQVRLRREALAAWLKALAETKDADAAIPADSVFAILTVRGELNGTMRAAERSLSSRSLVRVVEALTRATQDDSKAAWRVNYLKHSFGSPLAPDEGWRLVGR